MNILKHYKKINDISELNVRQSIAVLGFYNATLLPKTSDITFTYFVAHNVYVGLTGEVVIGFANEDGFFDKWRKEPTSVIHLHTAFWGLTSNEENEFINNLKSKLGE